MTNSTLVSIRSSHATTDKEPNNSADCISNSTQGETQQGQTTDNDTRRSRRSAAVGARDKIIACFTD